MAGGINISPTQGAELALLGTITTVGRVIGKPVALPSLSRIFRPSLWNKPATTSITVPPSSTSSDVDSTGTLRVKKTASSVFVFDGVMHVGHSQTARPTRHPVQTGANITDNIVLQPARLRLEVVMSDAMDSYAAGMWTGSSSKSVAAFKAMVKIKDARTLVTVSTRLQTYTNMAIVDVQTDDTNATSYGLRMNIEFEQIFMVTVATQQMSARAGTTDSTGLGTKQALDPSAATVANNQLPSPVYPSVNTGALTASGGTSVGAGTWSSNPTSQLAVNP